MSPLFIQTTGVEEYAPGGTARIKVLNIGGPGAGKTRWASYFPAPIYADCERGLASVADRKVPFVNIKTSQDMLDLLTLLKQESSQPVQQRRFQTVVIDTLDAFQRKIKNEWMEKEKKQTFTGWEAWGFLNSRMQLLMTRLLNLDMHVVVNVHYKDRTTKDDETGKESHQFMLQLQGELADTAYNDFDLVGWMGTYWEAVNGERVQKRGLTFTPTPEKPFLKDRLHVTPKWLEVAFAPSDFEALFARVQEKAEEIGDSQVLGEVPSEAPEAVTALALAPGAVGTGAMPATGPREVPLSQMDKPTLTKLARERGVTKKADGTPIQGNTLKAELIAAITAHQAKEGPDAKAPAAPASAPAPERAAPAGDGARPAPAEPVANAQRTTVAADPSAALKEVPEGLVNTRTGEIVEPTREEAVAQVEETLGATVIDDDGGDQAPAPTAAPEPAPAPATAAVEPAAVKVCEVCSTPLGDEVNQDAVKLAWIKYRKHLCAADYAARKNSRVSA